MSRFCVDFLYLNSNTQAFLYTIPNVDELTGSFTRHIPNFISSITSNQGFFDFSLKLKQWDLKWVYVLFHLPVQFFLDLTVHQVDDAIRPSCEVAVYKCG
jgi:hypothetical protein